MKLLRLPSKKRKWRREKFLNDEVLFDRKRTERKRTSRWARNKKKEMGKNLSNIWGGGLAAPRV